MGRPVLVREPLVGFWQRLKTQVLFGVFVVRGLMPS
jgi:hypothetical protein